MIFILPSKNFQARSTYFPVKGRKFQSTCDSELWRWLLLSVQDAVHYVKRCSWNGFNYFIITWDPGLVYRDRCLMTPFLAYLISTGVYLPRAQVLSKKRKKTCLAVSKLVRTYWFFSVFFFPPSQFYYCRGFSKSINWFFLRVLA